MYGIGKVTDSVIVPIYWKLVDAVGDGLCVDICPEQNINNSPDTSQIVCKDKEKSISMDECMD